MPLAVPALSAAAPVQLGSSLASGPVAGFGCEAEPAIVDTSGNHGLVPNTKGPDCTWGQAGAWGSATDPRVSSVPGDGRIIRAEILSGPNPAPPILLVPNAVTTIPLDIAVERNTRRRSSPRPSLASSPQGRQNGVFVRLLCGGDVSCQGRLEPVGRGGALASARAGTIESPARSGTAPRR